jgi:hypothetical protein
MPSASIAVASEIIASKMRSWISASDNSRRMIPDSAEARVSCAKTVEDGDGFSPA